MPGSGLLIPKAQKYLLTETTNVFGRCAESIKKPQRIISAGKTGVKLHIFCTAAGRSGVLIPCLQPPAKEKAECTDKNAAETAAGIEQDIIQLPAAAGDKMLMKFIKGGIQCTKGKRYEQCFFPGHVLFSDIQQRTETKRCINAEMGAFAQNKTRNGSWNPCGQPGQKGIGLGLGLGTVSA